MATYPVVEHREGRLSRWLRARRLRIALLIGVLEALFVVFGDLGWFWVVGIALLVFAFYYFVGRTTRFDAVHQISWTAAVSQLLPLLVPLLVVLIGTLVIVAVVVLALAMAAFLYLDRRA
jgi:hypothetical protein